MTPPQSESPLLRALRPPGLTNGDDLGSMLAAALVTFAAAVVAVLLENGGNRLAVEIGHTSVSTVVPIVATIVPLAVHWWDDPPAGTLLGRVIGTTTACFWGATAALVCALSLSGVVGYRLFEDVRLAPVATLLGSVIVGLLSLVGDHQALLDERERWRDADYIDLPDYQPSSRRIAAPEPPALTGAEEFERLARELR